jgi:hypothetical protein
MKSFSKATLSKLIPAVLLVGGVFSTSSVTHASSCDASMAIQGATSSQPTSLSITGAQISRSAMNTLWGLTTSEDSEKFRTLGHVIGAAHNWMGDCTYPGLGIGNGSGFDEDTKNVTLWLWQNGINLDLAREAVYQLIGETEGAALLDVQTRTLTGDAVVLNASRTMTAYQSRSFSWDLDGDGTYEVSTGSTPTVSASWSTAGIHAVGVKVSRPSGVSQTAIASIEVLHAPNGNTPGISILNGQPRTTSRDVVVSMIWPAYATAALVSNDGAFSPMRTTTVALSDSFAWSLEDAGDGVYSTAVYLRFIGAGIDPTRTYIDTIVLDRTPVTTTTTVPATTTTTTTTPTSTTPPSDAVAQSNSTRRGVSSMSVRSLTGRVARSSQQVKVQVVTTSRRICRVAGSQVIALRSGNCQVKISVRTTNGRVTSRVVSFQTKS